MEGLAGNVALNTNHTDSHYTNLVIVDYTIGVMDLCGGSNRYTRVHVWVGALPEYVPNSICYVLKGYTPDYGEIYLESCYADTGEIGFDLYTHVRMVGCAYFNNYSLTKLDHTTCVRNNSQKPVLIADSIFTKMSPNAIFYSGVTGEQVTLRDNIFRGQFDDLKE